LSIRFPFIRGDWVEVLTDKGSKPVYVIVDVDRETMTAILAETDNTTHQRRVPLLELRHTLRVQ